MKKVCFIGGGNMATAMIAGLMKSYSNLACHVVEPAADTREKLVAQGAIAHARANRAAIENADAVVLAVKPQMLKDVCAQLAPHLRGELIVSIAAGTSVASIARWLALPIDRPRIARAMPNTPALVGRGMTGVYVSQTLSHADSDTAIALMESCGSVLRVADEAMIDAVTAVSGSGPAYVFHWIESMFAAAEAVGFSAPDARTLVLETLKGATALAESSPESPGVLRERVTSKGGTTAAALAVLEGRDVRGAMIEAVRAARDRGRELGEQAD
jgi:pyrroline-5-carboxylate reductase